MHFVKRKFSKQEMNGFVENAKKIKKQKNKCKYIKY